ncbi:MAG: hypothetical protein CML16_14215 [Pusillimonas sp.]|nr:hypothetical protein [Pusillimonas sp.]MBC43447.1 hypothetical protein [Pusillimonas sp.]|tara:strand:+ start:22338 stop:22982 length:645 start_codon:yes stop_codon:yes gene_type:complete
MASNSAPPLPIGPLQGLLYRFATPASHQAALSLTGNLRAAAILNTLLENAAPPRLKHVAPLVRQALLSPCAPWSNPLRGPNDTGLLVGTAHLHAAVNACAQRQQQFWNSMPAHPGLRCLHSVHTLYSITYATNSGVNLRAIALAPEQIHTTAGILRGHNVEVFTYPAADPLDAPDIGVLNHHAVENSEMRYVGTWVCEVSTRGTQIERHTLPTK